MILTEMKSLSPDQYTVGWIAPLPAELIVALEMLDEEHEAPVNWTPSPKHKSSYRFGRVGKLNVLLICLSPSDYGPEDVAAAVSAMLRSFPSIRFGLLVGIGAGVPKLPGRDIRLGDVVVSDPSDKSGGFVQYHLGGEQSHDSERVRVLNKPPPVLLAAVSKLQTQLAERRTNIAAIVDSFGDRMPDYSYQDAHTAQPDRLFQDSYPHASDKDDCANCKRNFEQIRTQAGTFERMQEPKIFFGSIASGNIVVKDTRVKAEIVAITGDEVMCIEMEAAGLMDSFPCLVIRGICDYGDSHTTGAWQKYAALTAAATTKQLLLDMDAEQLESTEKACEAMSEDVHSILALHKPLGDPTAHIPAAGLPTTDLSTSEIPTVDIPTVDFPTVDVPTTNLPTTDLPTTAEPIANTLTTTKPATSMPITAMPTTAMPARAIPTVTMPATAILTAVMHTTAMPTTAFHATSKPSKISTSEKTKPAKTKPSKNKPANTKPLTPDYSSDDQENLMSLNGLRISADMYQANLDGLERLQDRIQTMEDKIHNYARRQTQAEERINQRINGLEGKIGLLMHNKRSLQDNTGLEQRIEKFETQLKKLQKWATELEVEEIYSYGCY